MLCAGGVVGVIGVIALWLALPGLTCWWLRGQAPLEAGAVVIRGARWGGEVPQTMVVGVCDKATFLAIWHGSSGRWQTGALLADGQHAWGTFTAAPEISWRLDIDDSVSEPRISAVVPQGVAQRLLARALHEAHAPVGGVHVATATLIGVPGAAGLTTWDLNLAGTALLEFNQQQLPLRLEACQAQLETRLGDSVRGNRQLAATVALRALAGEGPFIGPLAPLRTWVESQIRLQYDKYSPAAQVPDWWPPAVHWDLQVVHPAQQEL